MLAALLLLTAIASADDLAPLSDEFNDASTLANWKRVYAVEGWGANQLEAQDINTTRPGKMLMMPFTSTWYNDYRGELTFKEVQGDFVVTTDVEATARAGGVAPHSIYSLAGIMVRAPRAITPATWHPGGENYVFLSLGAGNPAGQFQFEVKTTVNSNSTLILAAAPSSHAVIQVARIGSYMIMLRNSDGNWTVHRRYYRPDLPSIVQVGMTTYTDFNNASGLPPFQHNSTVIHGGSPDLIAAFDYFRFARPNVPSSLLNADLMTVSDAQLLAFLGANANTPAPPPAGRHHAVRH